ncbi:MAG: response regulator, partial [candidate division Zixibacteria bacterium]|nr:response regulator [candidate division Zixibacteria bacterium]
MKRRANVLVVDDEKTVCNSCRKILTREGYNVDVALSGEEALNKVRGNG